MYAREEHSDATISLWRDELLRLARAPFDTGPDSVMVAFASNAELQCFLALGWPFPTNVLDPYVENIVAINGNTAVWPPPDEKAAKAVPDCSTRSSCMIYPRGRKNIRTGCVT
jgi:hypothetical protein